MAIPLANLNGHLNRIMSDIPQIFTWNGTDYSGVRSTPDASQTLELGGLDQKVEFQLFCKTDSLPTIPIIGTIFIIDGIKMRILDVRKSPDGNLLTFLMGFARIK